MKKRKTRAQRSRSFRCPHCGAAMILRPASEIYRTLKRMIERGQTNGLEEKIDIFFAAGKLTESEYQELIAMLEAE